MLTHLLAAASLAISPMQMTDRELVMQLLVVPTHGHADEFDLAPWLAEHPVGGVIFMRGMAGPQLELVQRCQDSCPIPLLICQDQEWGPQMRLPDGVQLPRALTLGALPNCEELEPLGRAMGQLGAAVGVNWLLQPVADVTVDPKLAVVGSRSLGQDPNRVGPRVAALIRGIQSTGLLACAKHFPGHGAASADSHHELPHLPDDAQLCEQALIPFKSAIDAGVETVMVGHLLAPVWDAEQPASLSAPVMQELLRQRMGFDGLVVTDSFHMQAILDGWPLEEAAVEAIIQGADMVFFGIADPAQNRAVRSSVDRIVQLTLEAIEQGRLSRCQLEEKVGRILRAKARCTEPAAPDLTEISTLVQRIYNRSVTLLHDDAGLLPLRRGCYHYEQIQGPAAPPIAQLLKGRGPTTVLAIFPEPNLPADRFGVSEATERRVRQLGHRCAVIWLGLPWGARYFEPAGALLLTYEATDGAQKAAAQVCLGRQRPVGQLPVDISIQVARIPNQ